MRAGGEMINACTVAYVCLAGAGAGCFLLSCLWGRFAETARRWFAVAGCATGAISVGIAVMFLVFDLGRPELAWRVFLAPMTSIISLGAWFIGAFLLFAIACGVGFAVRGVRFSIPLVACAVALCVAVMLYTGVLFYVAEAISLWHSVFLPLFFVASSLTMGAAMLVVANVALPVAARADFVRLGKTARALSFAEGAAAILYLRHAFVLDPETAGVLFWGELSPVFYLGGILCGFAAPWVLSSVPACASDREFRFLAVAVLMLIGGVCMRCAILFAPFVLS